MKMKNKSQYSSMYLVPQDIYKRLLDSADSREKIKIGDLNKFDVGNESGAFPDTPLTPDQDGYDDDKYYAPSGEKTVRIGLVVAKKHFFYC